MDLFKNLKDLKAYCTELSDLQSSITANGTKVKIGKFKIVDTPSDDAAKRLQQLFHNIIESEYTSMTEIYRRIEVTLEEIQTDIFKLDDELKETTLKFGSKVKE